MKTLKTNLVSSTKRILSMLLLSLVALNFVSCSKDDSTNDDEEDGVTEVRYVISLDNAAAKSSTLQISYATGNGLITTDAASFGLSAAIPTTGKTTIVSKPFPASISVSGQNASTEAADLRIQINVNSTVKKTVSLKIPAKGTASEKAQYVIEE